MKSKYNSTLLGGLPADLPNRNRCNMKGYVNAHVLKILAPTKLLPLLLWLALPAVAQAQYYYTNSYGIWSYTPTNAPITITGLTNIPLNGVVVIPDTINGYPVTNIGNSAFYDLSDLTNVTIGTNVTSIGNFAFEVCLSLKSVTIGTNVASIGVGAFSSCTGLTNIMIGNGVTNIGASAFQDCAGLINISVDPANPIYSSVAGVLFDKSQTTLIEYPGGKAGSYLIPSSVTSIAVVAFLGCAGLTGVTIPGSVTGISVAPFEDCTSLTAITVDATNPFYSSVAGVLFDKSQTTLIEYPGGKVGSYSIPSSVTRIGNNAFLGCARLTEVIIPGSVTTIESYAFDSCTSLISVTIPDSVTSIWNSAFFSCTGLTNVTIGSSVTSIESYAFGFCTKLAKVYFDWNSPTTTNDSTVFSSDPATVYYVPGTTGWGSMFDGLLTAPWFLPNPQILTGNNPGFGVQSNGFGFIISWLTNISVVVDATTNLAKPAWSPVSTNTFTGGVSYFSDPQWTNYLKRFYRLSSP